MRVPNDTVAKVTLYSNTDVAGGGDCVITLNAVADEYHTVDWVGFGYYDTPAANTALTISDGTTTLQWPMTTKGPGEFTFGVRGVQFGLGKALTVTLEDGGQIKDLNIAAR